MMCTSRNPNAANGNDSDRDRQITVAGRPFFTAQGLHAEVYVCGKSLLNVWRYAAEQEEYCKRACIPPVPMGMITIGTASLRNRKLATLSLGVRLSDVKKLARNISAELELLPLIKTCSSGFVNLSAEWCCFFAKTPPATSFKLSQSSTLDRLECCHVAANHPNHPGKPSKYSSLLTGRADCFAKHPGPQTAARTTRTSCDSRGAHMDTC